MGKHSEINKHFIKIDLEDGKDRGGNVWSRRRSTVLIQIVITKEPRIYEPFGFVQKRKQPTPPWVYCET